MANSNEAQLLSDLLRDIAREDARLDAAHLETRVIEASASDRAILPSFGATGLMRWAIAATVAAAALVPAVFWLRVQEPVTRGVKVDVTEEVVGQTNRGGPAEANGPARTNRPAKAGHVPQIATSTVIKSAPIVAAVGQSPVTQSPIAPIAQSPITPSLDEFVPLMPMTERELSGPFQLVRVQMPRASLGALQSPLELPNELVEADVLLGEDGMARAIRVSKSGSVYPWRSR
jgi:hypothetical protein